MWQERFGYSYEQATAIIGFTKATTNPPSTQQSMLSPSKARVIYLLKLDDPLDTSAKVQIAANLPTSPEVCRGTSDEGEYLFCKIDGLTKSAIENWLSTQNRPGFRPLFVPVGAAYKELSSDSLYPTLGKDFTLPQYRPQDAHLLTTEPSFGRTQHQYPVWYFFYGTLASVPKLRSLLSLSEEVVVVLHRARLLGGRMKTWGQGKYNALVDALETSCVEGSAYLVASEDHEDRLRKYETEAYEVVRCLIEMDGTTVQACTFTFIGEVD
ncbi:hypothetical protein D0Z07_1674 [Hyphodiscus hymeniophilus]|uniref:Putative gamma-glutamylcyclotransferase n=1 Tax=Hyphodiscus hymeniophilus TaxID=353542 RepID=A0A9P6VPN9_9HELO|nr:hypothetical protein D0Z07_1674 [Hyphodiscus hymeniophilus]